MKYLFYAILILLGFIVVFSVGPAVVGFFAIFKRNEHIADEKTRLFKKNNAEFLDKISLCEEFFKKAEKKRVGVKSFDGLTLCGNLIDGGFDKTVIFSHGYRTHPFDNFCAQICDFYENGYNVLIINHRAHKESDGKYTSLGQTESRDILEWVKFVDRDEKIKKIVLYGMSMGSSAVMYASDKIESDKVSALILDCGFESPSEQLKNDCRKRRIPPFAVVPFILVFVRAILGTKPKKSVCDSLKNTKIPALFIHGTEDTAVPCATLDRVYGACASKKEKILVEGAKHTTGYLVGKDDIKCRIFAFIGQNGKG